MEREAADVGITIRRQTQLHWMVAEISDSPEEWLFALSQAGAASDAVRPYLSKALALNITRGEELLRSLLTTDLYRPIAVDAVLGLEAPPHDLLETALAQLPLPGVDDLRFGARAISAATMLRLLQHPNDRVRSLAALGEWHREASGGVRNGLLAPWRAAILASVEENSFSLLEILRSDSALAFDWVSARFDKPAARFWRLQDPICALAPLFDTDGRLALVLRMGDELWNDDVFDALVRDDIDIYREWLAVTADRRLKVRPLRRWVDERWERMAIAALDSGITPEEVAQNCTPWMTGVMMGPFSQFYAKRLPPYERLATHPDPRLRPAGRAGGDWVRDHIERELAREKFEAVRGI